MPSSLLSLYRNTSQVVGNKWAFAGAARPGACTREGRGTYNLRKPKIRGRDYGDCTVFSSVPTMTSIADLSAANASVTG